MLNLHLTRSFAKPMLSVVLFRPLVCRFRILVGVRKDIDVKYEYPKPYKKIYNLKDALKKGELYDTNVPKSNGAKYP